MNEPVPNNGQVAESQRQMAIEWFHDHTSAQEQALRLRRPILIDVYKVP